MKITRSIVGVVATLIVAWALTLPVSAIEYGSDGIRGYASDAPLNTGTVVRLTDKSGGRVKSVSQTDQKNILGVVIDPTKLSLRFSNESLENEAYVASSGTYDTLVSTQGGTIAAGDYLTLSSVDGVIMKAGTEEKMVYGRAAGSFDGKGVTMGTTTLNDTAGKANKTVQLGLVPVTIDIKSNPNQKESTKANLPEQLQRVGEQIAEKEVSPIRIYLSVAIAVISLIAAIAVLYGGVRSGVISIGRNPMSKKSIFRALLEIILTSCLILIIGLFAVYLLLKL